MSYTWRCARCQSPWNGSGIYCNACQTVDALDRIASSSSVSSSGGGGGGGGGAGGANIYGLIGLIILDGIFFKFFFTKIVWMLLKVGAYFAFGGLFWAEPEDFGI